jgi:HrpA-like RNA helicase/8-oxo-dGTP pyrophosphatase MutT (NUDIX family)
MNPSAHTPAPLHAPIHDLSQASFPSSAYQTQPAAHPEDLRPDERAVVGSSALGSSAHNTARRSSGSSNRGNKERFSAGLGHFKSYGAVPDRKREAASRIDPDELDARVGKHYAAAGIMFLRRAPRPPHHLQALLTVETRRVSPAYYTFATHVFGGKREGAEAVRDTAVREFCEELSDAVTAEVVLAAIAGAVSIYVPRGRFVLFVAQVAEDTDLHKADELFLQKTPYGNWEAAEVHWVDVDSLKRKRISYTKPNSAYLNALLAEPAVEDVLRSPPPPADTAAQPAEILSAIVRRSQLVRTNPEKYLLPSNYEAQLAPAAVSELPKGPIQAFGPTEPEFAARISMVSDAMRTSVVAIRTVNVPAQRAKFVAAAGTPHPQTLWHGTPDPNWATAISLTGFDIQKRGLHGQAYGPGTYTTEDITYAAGYAGRSGTLIHLDGKVSATTRNNKPMFIFPDNDAVLPVTLFDFAASCAPPAEVAAALAALDAQRSQHDADAAVLATIPECCAAAKSDFLTQWSTAYERLERRSGELLVQIEHSGIADDNNAELTELQRQALSLRSELSLLDKHMPICLHEKSVVAAMRTNDVLFVQAETGSGKSVVLCQWAADKARPNDDRCVCVLQPTRANAESIARFVAQLRGTTVGAEIGLHMGGGIHKDNEGETRIIFMTHGYFNAAASPQFLARFHTIIVDEAHVRSVDVELSLALVKQHLLTNSQATTNLQATNSGDDPQSPLKVIIASATLPDVDRFAASILPANNLLRHDSMLLAGRSFPVFTLRRPIPGADDLAKLISSTSNSHVICSHAVAVTLEIMQRAPIGDILTFLPRTAEIRQALITAFSADAVTNKAWNSLFAFTADLGVVAAEPPRATRGAQTHNTKRVEFIAFSGSLTAAERLYVQNPAPGNVQRVIFCTNVAETGLTFPNARFVVDSGLENGVQYDHSADIHQHVVRFASQASIQQRKGRAGRCASGFYIPLFSEEQEASMPQETPGATSSGDLTPVFLRQLVQPELSLREPIPPAARDAVHRRLAVFGIIDWHRSVPTLTDSGRFVARYGGSLRVGLVMFAANQLGVPLQLACAAAAIIQNRGATEALLRPMYTAIYPATQSAFKFGPPVHLDTASVGRLTKLVDRTSDHITAVRVLLQYAAAVEEDSRDAASSRVKSKRRRHTAVSRRQALLSLIGVQQEHLDTLYDLMRENQAKCFRQRLLGTRQIIENEKARAASAGETLPDIPFDAGCIADEDATSSALGGAKDAAAEFLLPPFHPNAEDEALLRSALMQAHADHMAYLLQPGKADEGLRLESLPAMADAQASVVAAFRSASGGDSSSTAIDAAADPSAVMAAVSVDNQSLQVKPFGCSVTARDTDAGLSAAIYTDLVCTDIGSVQRVSLLTLVTPDQLAASVPDWAQATVQRLKLHERASNEVLITPQMQNVLLRNSHALRRDIERNYGIKLACSKQLDGSIVLTVMAPAGMLEDVTTQLLVRLAEFGDQPLRFKLQKGVASDPGFRRTRDALKGEIEDVIRKVSGTDPSHQVYISTAIHTLTVTVSGYAASAAVPMVTAFVNRRMQPFLEHPNVPVPSIVGSASAAAAGAPAPAAALPNLVLITSPQTPASTDPLVRAAHAAIWQGDFRLYGGMVRDFIIRGEPANDVDIVAPQGMDLTVASARLVQLLAPLGYKLVGSPKIYNAAKHTFSWQDGTQITIDVTKDEVKANFPFVDTDVGNFIVSRTGIAKRRDFAGNGLTLAESIKHCSAKQFVFMCRSDDKSRIERVYFGRGWTCINTLPPGVNLQPPAHLYKPDPRYSDDYSAQPPGVSFT